MVREQPIAERVVGERYQLTGLLGRGGMGRVWRADDPVLGRKVAVKEVFLPEAHTADDPSAMRGRALREARALARLSHPGVVTVYDVVEEQGRLFIVMELVEGRSLAERVREDGPMEPIEAARIGAAVANILAAAHREGIVHRDVKPGNVLLATGGDVKLADFGIASVRDDTGLTLSGQVLGSPHYMAPEQALGQRSGPPTDLWGLGATLYHALEGRPPFEAEHAMGVLTAVLHREPPPPQRSGPLGPVVISLLHKDPSNRPSAEEASRMLEAAAEPPATPMVDSLTGHETDTATEGAFAEDVTVPLDGADEEPESRSRLAWAWVAALLAVALIGFLTAYMLTRPTSRPDEATDRAAGSGPAEPEAAETDSGEASEQEQPPQTPEETEPVVPAGWETYVEESTGWQLSYPSHWDVEVEDESMIDFVDPETGSYLRVDWGDDPDPSPMTNWRALADSFASRHEGYEEITIEPTTFKGYKAAIWEFRFVEDGTTFHAVDLGFVTPDHGFALFFQTTEEEWEGSQDVFKALQDSFQVPE